MHAQWASQVTILNHINITLLLLLQLLILLDDMQPSKRTVLQFITHLESQVSIQSCSLQQRNTGIFMPPFNPLLITFCWL